MKNQKDTISYNSPFLEETREYKRHTNKRRTDIREKRDSQKWIFEEILNIYSSTVEIRVGK